MIEAEVLEIVKCILVKTRDDNDYDVIVSDDLASPKATPMALIKIYVEPGRWWSSMAGCAYFLYDGNRIYRYWVYIAEAIEIICDVYENDFVTLKEAIDAEMVKFSMVLGG